MGSDSSISLTPPINCCPVYSISDSRPFLILTWSSLNSAFSSCHPSLSSHFAKNILRPPTWTDLPFPASSSSSSPSTSSSSSSSSALSPSLSSAKIQPFLAGYSSIKDKLLQLLSWPLNHSLSLDALGVQPSRGALLFGPSGCGKTTLVHEIVQVTLQGRWNCLTVGPEDLSSRYLGESEEKVRNLWKTAQGLSPCILFLDNMEQIAIKRGERESLGIFKL